MNILYGLYLPDSEQIIIEGKRVKITSPYDSIKHGIGMVHHFPLSVKVKELSSDIKQKIEIIRSLYRNVRLLILDEPTTSLVQSEFQQLLKSLQILVKRGVTVVLSNKIKEIMEACDTVTVLRKGTVQGSLIHEEMTKENLLTAHKETLYTHKNAYKYFLSLFSVLSCPYFLSLTKYFLKYNVLLPK